MRSQTQLEEDQSAVLAELPDTFRHGDSAVLAAAIKKGLRARGHRVELASSRGGCGAAALLNLRHTCLYAPRSHAEGGRVVLEPNFRAQFAIGRPTPAYEAVLGTVPEAFVGTLPRLTALVEAMCEQMAVAFGDTGMSVPPWRQVRSLMSKWQLPAEAAGGRDSPPMYTQTFGNPAPDNPAARGTTLPTHPPPPVASVHDRDRAASSEWPSPGGTRTRLHPVQRCTFADVYAPLTPKPLPKVAIETFELPMPPSKTSQSHGALRNLENGAGDSVRGGCAFTRLQTCRVPSAARAVA